MKKIIEYLDKHFAIWASILMAALFVAGLFAAKDYGMPCDEGEEMKTLLSNAKEYAGILGNEELVSFLDDCGVPFISQSEEIDHGEAMYYPLIPATIAQYRGELNARPHMLLVHYYTYILYVIGVFGFFMLIYYLSKSRMWALAGTLLYVLCPDTVSEAFYNTKDMVLVSLTVWAFYFGLRMTREQKFRWAVLLGIMAAFSTNIRIIGLWTLGILGIYDLLYLTIEKKWTMKRFWCGFTAVASFLITFVLITPACLVGPLKFIQYYIQSSTSYGGWNGFVLFNGTIYNYQTIPLPWYYLPETIAITLPLIVDILIVLGIIAEIVTAIQLILHKKPLLDQDKFIRFLVPIIYIAVAMYMGMVGDLNYYNGWRHFYFLYGPMLCLAIMGARTTYHVLLTWAKGRENILQASAGLLTVGYFVHMLLVIIWLHPFEYTYYNCLTGSEQNAKFEFDYWNQGAYDCLMKFMETLPEDKQVTICATDFMSEQGYATNIPILPDEYKDRIQVSLYEEAVSEYVFVNFTYYTQEILKYGVDHIVNNIDEMEPVFIEKRGKNQIMGIYRRKNVPVETGQ